MPIIKFLQENNPEVQMFWLGHKHSMKGDKNYTLEYREITTSGIPFYELKAGKFYRTFSLIHWLKIPFGFFQALYLLLKLKPDLIMSFGGYLAVPVVIAGKVLNIPFLTHEQTVTTGYANNLIGKFADKIFVSWHESVAFFPREKVIFSGIPLRESIFNITTSNFSSSNELPYILIIAGKTGSVMINDVIFDLLETLLGKYNVIHQCGDHSEFKSYDALSEKYSRIKDKFPGQYFLKKFIFEDEIGEAYGRASVVVSRAGAHTIAELNALNKKCVLIPISWVSHNEQFKNAQILKERGLAQIVQETELTSENLLSAIENRMHTSTEQTDVSNTFAEDSLNSVKIITNEILTYKKKE
ncbi:hypothetical protein A2415_04615 [candidate division WWE3 bacterium RIFOXYC1_FULL_39_7]|uniref:UDP-N-acetylglucosamine--N-acetylmuramyl-(pentapeptide) pyrophosphoryl-undecaprenol N-acetylglucosamine transferase n=2 Tax=Katanobacteria TaxID=422282 RepID=A0A1F4WLF0_UNCKA|nr:MAG: hypothetical protein A2415_04615 [candidate division WWE3 bacterium RIFOXYC1_FULL_39_7]